MLTARYFAVAAALLVSGVLATPAAQAQTPAKSKKHDLDITRAYDPCPNTVIAPDVDICTPVATDTTSGWIQANVKVKPSGKGPTVYAKGKGFSGSAPTKVGLRLSLRTTSSTKVYQLAAPVICGTTSGSSCGYYFAAADGKINGKQLLYDCLVNAGINSTTAAQIAKDNIEIMDAELVNCDTGDVFGKPGILQAAW
ncbi:hypothetical protein L6Q96_15245 [Candidatus Binatia bacterium]|nr:hypothetical protein [Candidatus Binatia bacterium]